MSNHDKVQARRKPAATPRRRSLSDPPGYEGGAFYFEVRPGWETRILRDDNKVTIVLSVIHLAEALQDDSVMTIFIPGDSQVGPQPGAGIMPTGRLWQNRFH